MNFAWKAASFLLLSSQIGCSVDRSVAREIRRELPKALGPAESYDVKVRGTRLRDNSVQEVSVTAIGLRPKPEFRIERLDAKAWQVRVNPRSKVITQLGRLEADVTILATDIDDFVSRRTWLGRVKLSDVYVRFPDTNRAEILAIATFIQIDIAGVDFSPRIPISAEGQLEFAGPVMRLKLDSIRAVGVNLPPAALGWVDDAVNPLADLSGLPVALQFRSVQGQDSAVIARITDRAEIGPMQ